MESTGTKSEMVVARLTPELKAALRQAAMNSGTSLTRFVTKAIKKAVARAPREPKWASPDNNKRLKGLQEFIKQARAGGSTGYRWASRMIARARQAAARANPRRRRSEALNQVDALFSALQSTPAPRRRIDAEVISQVQGDSPVLGSPIPARRVSEFVRGAREASRERG